MAATLKTISLVILLALNLTFTQDIKSQQHWFPFSPNYNTADGVLDMRDWLDAPAGKHGFLTFDKENLVFEDGAPIKLWGTNICSRLPYVEAALADSFVEFLSHYGVNAIRFHKFSSHAYAKNISTALDPEKFDRFDYFQSQLKENGIYYGWSHIYGHDVQSGDSAKLLNYSEIKNLKYPWSHLNGSTSSLVNFAPDLQDLSIELTVNMLNHVNPYTGLRYADDPALAFIEFQNEDNIFWSAIGKSLEQAPTYRALLCKRFSEWLLDKYGTQAELEKAWGKENIPQGESLENMNVFPEPNHGLFDWAYKRLISQGMPIERHLLDKMHFLYETQLAFYKKFEKAIRDTGYRGVLVGSCWQAGSGIAHYYNLAADYSVGMIDRHNYFGAGGHQMQTGEIHNQAMIRFPGSGLLSTGLQQVIDRPFSFSEWMAKVPNEWTAEAAPLIAAYGMGLQGWDASFSFATDIPRFSRLLESERHGLYNATSPLHMGLYPALARLVYRGDIQESPVLATRNVHLPSLAEGKLGFAELVKQGHDVKVFTGTIPSETIAIGRCPAQFTETFQETAAPNLQAYWDKEAQIITSATDELTWYYGENQYATINSAGTKGLIGFARDQVVELDDWRLTCDNPFAVILITDLSKKGNLRTANKVLLTAVARARNTGMAYEYQGDETILIHQGLLPLLLEPVKATISLNTKRQFTVTVLDHDGVKTDDSIAVANGSFTIDGARDKTMYYLIQM